METEAGPQAHLVELFRSLEADPTRLGLWGFSSLAVYNLEFQARHLAAAKMAPVERTFEPPAKGDERRTQARAAWKVAVARARQSG